MKKYEEKRKEVEKSENSIRIQMKYSEKLEYHAKAYFKLVDAIKNQNNKIKTPNFLRKTKLKLRFHTHN